MIANGLVLTAGGIALARFYTKKSVFFLLLGAGLLATAFLDGYHAVITSSLMAGHTRSAQWILTPWSGAASRLFLSLLMCASLLARRLDEQHAVVTKRREIFVYLFTATWAMASFIVFMCLNLPPPYLPHFIVHRPVELIPSLLFAAALIGYSRRRTSTDGLDNWLALSLIASIATQIAMMSYGSLYDPIFVAAHLLKILSYVLLLNGLFISMYSIFKREEEHTIYLGRVNESLAEEIKQRQRAEEELWHAHDGLEAQVRARTAELGQANKELSTEIAERKREESKRQALEQQLRQAQKMEAVGRLAGGIAHDFNNLLMVIQSYTEMLQDSLPAHDRLRKNTQEIMKAAERGARLTGQMLAFSRKQITSPVVLDLNAVINETAKMLKRLIGEDIEFLVDPAKSLWTILADSDQIVHVLMNLCVNSRDAMQGGGTLTIATGNVTVDEGNTDGHPDVAPGEYVKFSVTDTGTGISKGEQEKIFDPFFTTKGVGKGTGLGLAMVYGVVKQSGGYVWIDSERGQGACFTIYLPRAKGTIASDKSVKAEVRPLGAETLLVAEDEEALREAMCDFLRSLGYTVLAASSGQQALSAASEHEGHIDLLITDVVMPKMSGRELSQMLGSLRPDLKTIHMSGYTDDAVLRHGIHESGATFLHKPFSLGTLARKVRDTIDRSVQ
jgi:signal transduction histidine kinase/ActR/RegA family two-component response regulator